MAQYNPAEGNFYFADEALERERDRMSTPANSMSPEEKHAIQVLFCSLLAKGQTIGKAVQIINGSDDYTGGAHHRVARKTLYMWRKFDEVFRDAWNDAYAMGTEMIEQKAHEVALEGNASLLIFAMKTRNPNRYAIDRKEVSGPGGTPVAVTAIEFIGVESVDGVEVGADDESTASPSG